MPQVFFYGVHVMAGQVLNARDRFGPMMWAPIANNVVSIMVLLMYLIVFERTSTGRTVHHKSGAAAGHWLHARHCRAGRRADPIPAGQRLPLPTALRLQEHRAGQDLPASQVDSRLRPRDAGRAWSS